MARYLGDDEAKGDMGRHVSGAPPVRHDAGRAWQNWSRTQRCEPAAVFEPATAEELAAVLRYAADRGLQVRAVGAGHSWSALVPTDDVIIAVHRLDRVHLDLTDADHPRVVAEAGATVRQINDVLEAHGLALPSNVVLESVRIGGLIATGSHGSGWQHRTLSDLVHAVELIDAAGEPRRFERGRDPDEVMATVSLSLGLCGVIWRLALDVVPSHRVLAVDRRLAVPAVLDNVADLVRHHDNLDLFWWPFGDRMWVKSWDRTDAPITIAPRRSRREHAWSHVTSHAYSAALSLARRVPRLTPTLTRTAFLATPSTGTRVVDLVEAVHYRRAIEVVRCRCLEVAFKVDDDFAGVHQAIHEVFDATRRWADRGHYPCNVTLNVRFIADSDCLLSPASGAGHTCYIEVLGRADPQQWEAFSGELGRAWLDLPRARPHWAKEYAQIPGIDEHLRRAYGADLDTFRRVRAELGVDPENRFVNHALAPLLELR